MGNSHSWTAREADLLQTTHKLLLLAALLLPLLALPVVAQDEADPADAKTLTELNEQWEKLTPEERKRMLPLYEERGKVLREEERRRQERERQERQERQAERLRKMTPEQLEEILKKLEKVRKRNLEDLKRKWDRAYGLWRKILDDLPPESKARVERFHDQKLTDIRTYSISRFFELEKQDFEECLTEEERRKLDRHRGPSWFEVRQEIEKAHVLADLPEAERARIAALPDEERCKAERDAVCQARVESHARIRQLLAGEIHELMALNDEEWEARMVLPRVKHLLKRMCIWDRDLLKTLERLPQKKLEKVAKELAKIALLPDPDEQKRAVKDLKSRYSR